MIRTANKLAGFSVNVNVKLTLSGSNSITLWKISLPQVSKTAVRYNEFVHSDRKNLTDWPYFNEISCTKQISNFQTQNKTTKKQG